MQVDVDIEDKRESTDPLAVKHGSHRLDQKDQGRCHIQIVPEVMRRAMDGPKEEIKRLKGAEEERNDEIPQHVLSLHPYVSFRVFIAIHFNGGPRYVNT